MFKVVYAIDALGFMTYEVLQIAPIEFDEEDNPIYELPKGYIDVPLPCDESGQLPFYRPRWTGTEWLEDMSPEEIDALKNTPLPLTEIDQVRLEMARGNAELFETMLTLMGGA